MLDMIIINIKGGVEAMDKVKRMVSREYIMKLFYQLDMTKEINEEVSSEDSLNNFLLNSEEEMIARYDEIRLQNSNDPEIKVLDEETTYESVVDKEYMKNLINRFLENQETVDGLINKYAKNWTVDRLAKVDLSIIRLSITEMLYHNDIPTKVSINEAIELSKRYCDEKSPSFINGILGSVVNEYGEKK